LALVFYPVNLTKAWVGDELYRKSHIIENATGSGTNYQVQITVHYGAGSDSGEDVYLDSKCQTDFDDIRFSDNDESTLLDYWLEEKTDSDNAVFWVEIADDLSSSDVTIYVYYGDVALSSISDGEATFLGFDDFEDGSIDTSKWESGQGAGQENTYWTEAGGVIKHNHAGSDALFWKTLTGLDDMAIETEFKNPTSSNYWVGAQYRFTELIRWWGSATVDGYLLLSDNGGGTDDLYRITNGASINIDSQGRADTTAFHRYSVRFFEDDHDVYRDGASWLSATDSNYQSDGYAGINARGSSNSEFEFFALRKYVVPEPSHGAWGSEEAMIYYVTFYNNTGGKFLYNSTIASNGTELPFSNNTVLTLISAPDGNLTYGFDNFTWDATSTITNVYNLTVNSNLTIWCYFGEFVGGVAPGLVVIARNTLLSMVFVVLVFAVIIYLVIKKK
jgi:hypothetical protein